MTSDAKIDGTVERTMRRSKIYTIKYVESLYTALYLSMTTIFNKQTNKQTKERKKERYLTLCFKAPLNTGSLSNQESEKMTIRSSTRKKNDKQRQEVVVR